MQFEFNLENVVRLNESGLGVIDATQPLLSRPSGSTSTAFHAHRTSQHFGNNKAQEHSPHNVKLDELIDTLGTASAKAQQLPQVITTSQRLFSSDNRFYIKILDNKAVGFIKMGKRNLFVSNGGGIREIQPVCVLDFYVHESMQRGGHGKDLFDFMLYNEKQRPEKLAYDRPSMKLLSFCARHFGLRKHIPQNNNFVVYDAYWNPAADGPDSYVAQCARQGSNAFSKPAPSQQPTNIPWASQAEEKKLPPKKSVQFADQQQVDQYQQMPTSSNYDKYNNALPQEEPNQRQDMRSAYIQNLKKSSQVQQTGKHKGFSNDQMADLFAMDGPQGPLDYAQQNPRDKFAHKMERVGDRMNIYQQQIERNRVEMEQYNDKAMKSSQASMAFSQSQGVWGQRSTSFQQNNAANSTASNFTMNDLYNKRANNYNQFVSNENQHLYKNRAEVDKTLTQFQKQQGLGPVGRRPYGTGYSDNSHTSNQQIGQHFTGAKTTSSFMFNSLK